jgi:hypothetical protein
MSKILSKNDIFEAVDLKTEAVEVPEWDGAVIVRTMTGTERDAYEAGLMKANGDGSYKVDTTNMRAKLVAYTAVDEAGALLFDKGDIASLAAKNAGAIERLFIVAQRLNGLGGQSVGQAEKNSVSGPSEDSVSGSPQPSA